MTLSECAKFDIGDLPLQSGATLNAAVLAYTTHGQLDAQGTNAVIFPTAYGGTHADNEWLIGPGKALDPERWFVVCPNLFGAGLSSSPSTVAGSQAADGFPNVTVYDNVAAQHRLMQALGVRKIALALGFSMGAQQAYHWACAHPELVERVAPICGSARTAQHNIVFLDGMRATLTADPVWNGGRYREQPLTGMRAVGSVWAAWGVSQAFYRERGWRSLGFDSREAFVQEHYIDSFAAADANNLLAMLWTWRHADISAVAPFNGDFARALASITARAVVMPSRTDLYFPLEDSQLEVSGLASADLAPIDSVLGHSAGGGGSAAENAFIDERVARLLAIPAA